MRFYLIAKIQQKSERRKSDKGLLTKKERKGLRERVYKKSDTITGVAPPFIQS